MQSFQNAFEGLVPPSLRSGKRGANISPDEMGSLVLLLEREFCVWSGFFFEPCDNIDVLIHKMS